MLNGHGNESGKKKSVGLMRKKKQLCTSSTLFCAFLFFVVLHDYNVKHLIYTSYVGNVVNAPRMFFLLLFLFAFFHCRSFSPGWPLAFLILSPPIFMFSTNAIRLLCFCLTL